VSTVLYQEQNYQLNTAGHLSVVNQGQYRHQKNEIGDNQKNEDGKNIHPLK
jgi:hypothetical protein